MMVGFQKMEVFCDTVSVVENEANLFSAELLLDDDEMLEKLKEFSCEKGFWVQVTSHSPLQKYGPKDAPAPARHKT